MIVICEVTLAQQEVSHTGSVGGMCMTDVHVTTVVRHGHAHHLANYI